MAGVSGINSWDEAEAAMALLAADWEEHHDPNSPRRQRYGCALAAWALRQREMGDARCKGPVIELRHGMIRFAGGEVLVTPGDQEVAP